MYNLNDPYLHLPLVISALSSEIAKGPGSKTPISNMTRVVPLGRFARTLLHFRSSGLKIKNTAMQNQFE